MGINYIGRAPLFSSSETATVTPSSSSGVTIPNLGVSVLGSTSTGAAALFTLQTPEKGYRKVIILKSVGASTTVTRVSSPSSDTGFITSTQDAITMAAVGDSVVLIGETTALWLLESQTTGVTYSSST
jgi:hypothetical protein